MEEEINKSCGLDIHKRFVIAIILSRSGEKQQQRFARDDDGILNLNNLVISEKCDVVACESTSDFWVPIYEALIDHLPVISSPLHLMQHYYTNVSILVIHELEDVYHF